MYLHVDIIKYSWYVIIITFVIVISTDRLGMLRIDCSEKTRLALHVPSSHELESGNIIIITSCGGSSVDIVVKPTMSLKKMVTQSKDSGSTGRPSLSAADTCNATKE